MREVARQAGVSLAAVSAVVNGATHTRLSAATRRRIEQVIAEVGYVPNPAARSLRSRMTRRVALVVHRIDNTTLHESVHGFHSAAMELGRTAIIGDAEWFTPGASLLSQLLAEGTVDGVVVHTPRALDADVLDQLRQHPRPVVTMENMGEGNGLWIAIDDADAARRATRHLVELGHRRIAWAGSPSWSHATRLRRDGYAEVMSEAGLATLELDSDFGYRSGQAVIEALLRRQPRPTAVVVHTGSTAVGMLAAAADAGLRVPEELSLVAIHDIDVAEYVRPALTCVRAPMFELGARAARVAITGDATDCGVITDVPNELMVRETTAPPAA